MITDIIWKYWFGQFSTYTLYMELLQKYWNMQNTENWEDLYWNSADRADWRHCGIICNIEKKNWEWAWGQDYILMLPFLYTLQLAAVFLKNLELYIQGKELNYTVDWSRGYWLRHFCFVLCYIATQVCACTFKTWEGQAGYIILKWVCAAPILWFPS